MVLIGRMMALVFHHSVVIEVEVCLWRVRQVMVDAWRTWLKQRIDRRKAQVVTEVLRSICLKQVPLWMPARDL